MPPEEKEKRHPENDEACIAQFFRFQSRFHKQPELPEDIGKSGNEPAHECDGDAAEKLPAISSGLHLYMKRFEAKRVTGMNKMTELAKRRIANEIGIDGTGNDVVEHPVAVHENNTRQYQNGNHRTDDVPAKRF